MNFNNILISLLLIKINIYKVTVLLPRKKTKERERDSKGLAKQQ